MATSRLLHSEVRVALPAEHSLCIWTAGPTLADAAAGVPAHHASAGLERLRAHQWERIIDGAAPDRGH